MKNLRLLNFLFFFACLLLGTQLVSAYDFEADGLFYKINDDGTTVTITTESGSFGSYTLTGDLVLPSTVTNDGNTYTVTAIDRYTFLECAGLTSVVIPNTITLIDDGAFYYCTHLEQVDVHDDVTYVGYDAFNSTPWLNNQADGMVYVGKSAYIYKGTMPEGTSINLREGTTGVSGYAFYNRTNLVSVTIPNSVTRLGERAFAGCSGLTSIDLPNGVTSLGWAGFEKCTGLTSVVIPASVVTVDAVSFSGCTGLTSVTITNGVKGIDYQAFMNCTSLRSLYIPESVEFISYSVFSGCDALESIQVESSNPVFDSRDNCNAIIITQSNLLSVGCKNTVIPNTVTTIGSYAFNACRGLTHLVIPGSVTKIYSGSFAGCVGLISVRVDNENTVYDSRGNCNAVIETATNTLFLGCQNTVIPNSITTIGARSFSGIKTLTEILIPSSVTKIEDNAFDGCSGLTSIDLPNSISSIGRYSFSGCTGLTSLVLPPSLTATDYCSFKGCSGLKSVTLPDSLKTIGYMSFSDCKGLESVVIPSKVTNISYHAFNGCYYLRDVTCLAVTPPVLGDYGFDSFCFMYGKLKVPATVVGDYMAAKNWNKFNLIEGIMVPGNCFEVDGICYKVTGDSTVCVTAKFDPAVNYSGDVVIPDTVNYEDYTFNVTAIEDNAFDGAEELTSVVIPAMVTSIGRMAFQGCTELLNVTIGCQVANIGEKAFNYCSNLQSVTCRGEEPPVMENVNVFTNRAYNQATLYVPQRAIDQYSNADFWYKFANIEGVADVGDVNGDGMINISDVTSLINLLLNGGMDDNAVADVNGDGHVNIADVTALINNLLNGE